MLALLLLAQADHGRELNALRSELDLKRRQDIEDAAATSKADLQTARQSLREAELRVQELTLSMETRVAEAVAEGRHKEVQGCTWYRVDDPILLVCPSPPCHP